MSDSTDTAGSTRPTDKAVHAWSLDGTLGRPRVPGPDGSGPSTAGGRAANALDLLDLPAELARRGYRAVQITHFQLPTRDAGYLAELRASLAASGITLDAFLVDDGDLTHPTDADQHERWISDRLADAEALGAHHARVVAGRSAPTPELLASSARRLSRLAAAHPGRRGRHRELARAAARRGRGARAPGRRRRRAPPDRPRQLDDARQARAARPHRAARGPLPREGPPRRARPARRRRLRPLPPRAAGRGLPGSARDGQRVDPARQIRRVGRPRAGARGGRRVCG